MAHKNYVKVKLPSFRSLKSKTRKIDPFEKLYFYLYHQLNPMAKELYDLGRYRVPYGVQLNNTQVYLTSKDYGRLITLYRTWGTEVKWKPIAGLEFMVFNYSPCTLLEDDEDKFPSGYAYILGDFVTQDKDDDWE